MTYYLRGSTRFLFLFTLLYFNRSHYLVIKPLKVMYFVELNLLQNNLRFLRPYRTLFSFLKRLLMVTNLNLATRMRICTDQDLKGYFLILVRLFR